MSTPNTAGPPFVPQTPQRPPEAHRVLGSVSSLQSPWAQAAQGAGSGFRSRFVPPRSGLALRLGAGESVCLSRASLASFLRPYSAFLFQKTLPLKCFLYTSFNFFCLKTKQNKTKSTICLRTSGPSGCCRIALFIRSICVGCDIKGIVPERAQQVVNTWASVDGC